MPANLKTLALRLCGYAMPTPNITLSAQRDGKSRAIAADVEEAKLTWTRMGRSATGPLGYWMLHIRAPLTPGETLVLRFREPMQEDVDAGFNEGEMSWPVGDAEPAPEQLGKLEVRQDVGVITIGHNASCSRDILSSYADIALLPAADAEPWLGALRYELRVDGDAPWVFYDSLPGMGMYLWNSSLGAGKDRLVVGCEAEPLSVASLSAYRMMPVLQPGEHRVRMVGILPDGTELNSQEVVLDMQCPPGTSGPTFDAGVSDAGSLFGKSDFQAASQAPKEEACAVLSPGRTHRPSSLVLLVAAFGLWHRRRRWREPNH